MANNKQPDGSVKIEVETYYWLKELLILPELDDDLVTPTPNATAMVILDQVVALETAAGVTHKMLLQKLAEMNNTPQGGGAVVMKDLQLVSNSTTEAAKLANWNRLMNILAAFPGISLTRGAVDEIMKGNNKPASDLLAQIYSVSKSKGKVVTAAKPQSNINGTRSVKENSNGLMSREEQSDGQRSQTHDPAVSDQTYQRLSLMTETTDLSACESLLEFFCVCAARETSVKPLQILSLFKDGNKNWVALLTKGKNGDHKPIVRMFGSILDNFSTLAHLLRAEYNNDGVAHVLEWLKPGLMAKDLRVASLACKSVCKIVELVDIEQGPMEQVWEAFTKVYGLFLALFGCFDTFGDLVLREVFSVCKAVGTYDIFLMFKDEFRKLLPDPKSYAQFLNHILTYYLLDDFLIEELAEKGVIDHLMRYALSSLEKPNSRDLQTYYQEFIELVCKFIHATPAFFTSKPQLSSSLLNQIKTSVLDSLNTGHSTLVAALVQVSDLLPILSSGRSTLSPALFKLLCQLYVVACKSAATRGFAHQTMRFCLEGIQSLPSDIVFNLALEWAQDSVKGTAYDSECCPSFFELMSVCLSHPSAQAAKFDEALDKVSLMAPRFKYFPIDWAKFLAEVPKRFGREIVNGGNKAVINLCCHIYVGLVQKQRQIESFVLQPGGVPPVPVTLSSQICLHYLVKDYQGAQWGNSHTLLVILHTSAKVQMLTDGEMNKGLYLAIESGWGKPDTRVKSYSPRKISSSVSSFKDLQQELTSLGAGETAVSPKKILDSLPQSESQVLVSPPKKKPEKKTVQTKKTDKKTATGAEGNSSKVSRAASANKQTSNWASDGYDEDTDMFAVQGFDSMAGGSLSDPQDKELPGYMKGMTLDPDIIKMRRFDEILKQQEHKQRELRDKREKERQKRLKEIKEALKKEHEDVLKAHIEMGESSKNVAPIPRANGRLIRSANISKGDTARKMEELRTEVKKEEKRKKRHMEVKAIVENRRQEILEAQTKNAQELAHQEKVKALMKAKLAESKAFIESEKEKLKKRSEEAVFLNLLKEVFEKSREEALNALPGKRMERMRSKFEKGIQKRAKENSLRDSLMKLLHSEGAKMVFKQNEAALKVMFDFLSGIDKEPRTIASAADKRIQCRTFFEFANMFGFVPLIMQVDELKVIYRGVVRGQTLKWNTTLAKPPSRPLVLSMSTGALRSTTKAAGRGKEPDTIEHELPMGLDFNQFKDILFRMSLKKKTTFDKSPVDTKPDEVKISYPVKTQFEDFSGKDFFDKEDIKRLEEVEETYTPKDMAEFHYMTLEGLMNYMKLPYDVENVKKKLVFMRADYLKNVRPKDHRTRRRPQARRLMKLVEQGEDRRERKVEDSLANMISILRDQKDVLEKSQVAKDKRDHLLKQIKEDRELSRNSDGKSTKGGATSTLIKEMELVVEKPKPGVDNKTAKTSSKKDAVAEKSKIDAPEKADEEVSTKSKQKDKKDEKSTDKDKSKAKEKGDEKKSDKPKDKKKDGSKKGGSTEEVQA